MLVTNGADDGSNLGLATGLGALVEEDVSPLVGCGLAFLGEKKEAISWVPFVDLADLVDGEVVLRRFIAGGAIVQGVDGGCVEDSVCWQGRNNRSCRLERVHQPILELKPVLLLIINTSLGEVIVCHWSISTTL